MELIYWGIVLVLKELRVNEKRYVHTKLVRVPEVSAVGETHNGTELVGVSKGDLLRNSAGVRISSTW